MLLLTEQEVRTLKDALNELYGLSQDNCWPPEDLTIDEQRLLARATDALLTKSQHVAFDPQI